MPAQHQKMGHRDRERLLIVNADDYGMCHTYNATIERLLLKGAISSATLMVPCPWARAAADFCKQHPQLDVGIHLTFTSEWAGYKWGPVTRDRKLASLTTADGWFHAGCAAFERQAHPDEVRTEIFAQIERAISWGIDPTHLDVHMYSLLGLVSGRDFLDLVIDACVSYRLPLRLPRSWTTKPSYPEATKDLLRRRITTAEERGISLIDDQFGLSFSYSNGESYEQAFGQMSLILRNLPPGISEILVHPGDATQELQALMPRDFPKREMESRLFLDARIQQLIAQEDIRLVDWRYLREYQRRSNAGASA